MLDGMYCYIIIISSCINTAGNDACLLAAWNGHLAVLKWLVSLGCPLDSRNANGNDCVMFAAMNGKMPVLEWLVEVSMCVRMYERGNFGG